MAMRDLMKLKTIQVAVPAGLAITLLCVPFILIRTPAGRLRTMQLAFLAPLAIVLFQAGVAWTPHVPGARMLRMDFTRRDIAQLLTVTAILTLFAHICIDPLLAVVLPGYFPKSLKSLFAGLPWMALFQPLVVICGSYAFAARLTRRPTVCLIAVVVARQGILLLQLGKDGRTGYLPALLLAVTGLYGLILGWSYRCYGFVGPAVIACLSQLRHVFRFL